MQLEPNAIPIISALFAFLFALQTVWLWRERTGKHALELRFKGPLDAEREKNDLVKQSVALRAEITTLRASYADKRAIYDQLTSEIAIFDEKLAFAELGVYEPHFNFNDSEAYKRAILEVREAQKQEISDQSAVICNTQWTIDGSKSKGKTFSARTMRLTLRAFNNECEASIANTRWNNVNSVEKRIIRAREQIDKLNASTHVCITDDFVALKLKELRLTHEYRERLKQEREQRAEEARAAREEARLQRDLEEAQDAEAHYRELLEQARREAERSSGASGLQLEAFKEQIRVLENKLAEAQAKANRAEAMAEHTRSGYVYVISNVGSFGNDVVKIGLTRRLDPADRVRELGDASVPFYFDTHAVIYSDDAPKLERALHAEFEPQRINAQNYRKEFFRVSLDEVESAVNRLAPNAPFFRDVEAQEYRETLARRQVALAHLMDKNASPFPIAI